jgi:uncharacterized protein YbcC (UPF0753/DUF2309 family)
VSFVFAHKKDLMRAIDSSQRLKNIVENEWIHLIRIDPETHQMEALTKEIRDVLLA